MQELFTALGVNGKLLLSQGVNFLVLFGVLSVVVYRPLLAILKERRDRIEFGLHGADEVERQLKDIAHMREKKIADADALALQKIHDAEEKGHTRHDAIVADASTHAQAILAEAAHVSEQRKAEEMARLHAQAQILIRAALAHAVALEPDQIDERLVRAAQNAMHPA